MSGIFCRLFGHSAVDIIDEYSRVETLRPYLNVGRRLIPAQHIHADIEGKFKCKRCGHIFTGKRHKKRWPTLSEL